MPLNSNAETCSRCGVGTENYVIHHVDENLKEVICSDCLVLFVEFLISTGQLKEKKITDYCDNTRK